MKYRLQPTVVIAYALLAGVAFLATKSFDWLIPLTRYSHLLILFLGMIAFGMLQWQGIQIQHPTFSIQASKIKQLIQLVFTQGVLLFFSLLFFGFLEQQTQQSPMLFGLESHYFIRELQANSWSLGWLPWAVMSVLGVGLSYIAYCLNRKPFFSRAMMWENQPNKLRFFLHELIMSVQYIIVLLPLILSTVFLLLWLLNTVNQIFGWGSIFATPHRTLFICSLVLIVFRKSILRLIDWMQKSRFSVGSFVLTYIVVFAFFFLWLYGSVEIFYSKEIKDIEGKIPMVQNEIIASVLNTKSYLLLLGWWAVWTPWLASVVARCSLGHSVIAALAQSLLVPTLFFGYVLERLDIQHFYGYFEPMGMQLFCVTLGLVGLWWVWSKTYTLGDVYRGVMESTRTLSKRSLSKWLMLATNWFMCYCFGTLLLGWLVTQLIVTVGLLGFLLVSVIFVGGLVVLLGNSSDAKTYNYPDVL